MPTQATQLHDEVPDEELDALKAKPWGRLFAVSHEYSGIGQLRLHAGARRSQRRIKLQWVWISMAVTPCAAELAGEDKVVFGRHPTCTYTYDDPVISNRHCCISRVRKHRIIGTPDRFTGADRPGVWRPQRLHRVPGGLQVRRVGIHRRAQPRSTNGTFVNDQKIGKGKRVALNHGDTVALSLKKKTAPKYLFHDCLRKPDFTQAKTPLHSKYNIVRPLGRHAGTCAPPS